MLNERKSHAFIQLKERFKRIESNIDRLDVIRNQPREYIKSYFDDLRELVDSKAEEAKQRIENERRKLIDGLKSHEDRCGKEAEQIDRVQSASVDKIKLKFQNEYDHWKDSLKTDVRLFIFKLHLLIG